VFVQLPAFALMAVTLLTAVLYQHFAGGPNP
jgi:hypothetical protein